MNHSAFVDLRLLGPARLFKAVENQQESARAESHRGLKSFPCSSNKFCCLYTVYHYISSRGGEVEIRYNAASYNQYEISPLKYRSRMKRTCLRPAAKMPLEAMAKHEQMNTAVLLRGLGRAVEATSYFHPFLPWLYQCECGSKLGTQFWGYIMVYLIMTTWNW